MVLCRQWDLIVRWHLYIQSKHPPCLPILWITQYFRVWKPQFISTGVLQWKSNYGIYKSYVNNSHVQQANLKATSQQPSYEIWCCFGHLTHWGRVTHICIGNLTIVGSDNGLSPGRRKAIIWANAGILLIGPLEIMFSEILIEIQWGSKYARGLVVLNWINMDRIVHLWWRILQVKEDKNTQDCQKLKFYQIQINSNITQCFLKQFWCWSWRNGLDYSYIPFFVVYGKSHQGITQSCTSPSQPPQPCCPSGWAGGSAGWDYVTVFAELSSCC